MQNSVALSHALAQYRQRAPVYDLELAAFEPIRRRAIACLAPAPGATVLDVGCGTGLSLGPLQAAVGPQGQVLGIEPCPQMLAQARQRVRRQGWPNVHLRQASAQSARLVGQADGALFFFTHDVLRSASALRHVLRHLKPGARVVAVGLQWAPPWALFTNFLVLGAALYSVSALEGLDKPWSLLAPALNDFTLTPLLGGGAFLASGTLAPAAAPRPRRRAAP
jgi:demethylmenaquinone methyltransferase/2-methoxy-6-polyprenyl-1,4-benzoquinol methylase